MSEYVTNASWVGNLGRPDAIDDIADQFERRTPSSAAAPTERAGTRRAAVQVAAARWPRSARGWRSAGRLHAPAGDRLTPS